MLVRSRLSTPAVSRWLGPLHLIRERQRATFDGVSTPTPPAAPDVRVTWVGHATALLDYGDFRILTDPLLRSRVAHLRRRGEVPAPSVADVDLVLLSHAHMDHLHVPSLRRIAPTIPVVAPRGTRSLLRRAGFEQIIEVVDGDRIEVGPATLDVVDAVHPAGRGLQQDHGRADRIRRRRGRAPHVLSPAIPICSTT